MTLQNLFPFCSTSGESVKKTNEQITMKAGHELHVHRYAKQYNLEHEIYKAYLSSSRSTGRNHMFPYF